MTSRPFLTLAWVVFMGAGANTIAGVVSNYTVNGKTVYEGATFEELRAVAGEPRAVEKMEGNDRYVEWVYRCAGKGAGPCDVVTEGGHREMRALFSHGRLKGIRFHRF